MLSHVKLPLALGTAHTSSCVCGELSEASLTAFQLRVGAPGTHVPPCTESSPRLPSRQGSHKTCCRRQHGWKRRHPSCAGHHSDKGCQARVGWEGCPQGLGPGCHGRASKFHAGRHRPQTTKIRCPYAHTATALLFRIALAAGPTRCRTCMSMLKSRIHTPAHSDA